MKISLEASEFGDFFRALRGYDPFPWQERLARRVAQGTWPDRLELPTASGKTACIEIAVFALALQADRPTSARSAPRRIFFVVDRRIVVDAAYRHADEMAKALDEADEGILRRVADRLRFIGGHDRPLGCERLRGGMRRRNAWTRTPTQAAVISCTVDQIGSRLLFRSYDGSRHMAPVHAGLAGNDALILLDEAHCALPFMQTAGAVQRFRGPDWAESPPATPFRLVVFSATLPDVDANGDVFCLNDEDRASAELRRRLAAEKPALLEVATKAKTKKDPSPEDRWRATVALAETLVDRALEFHESGSRKIAVLANRVATAKAAHDLLEERVAEDADAVLMTGRMRPIDRDNLTSLWEPVLRSEAPAGLERPVFVAATQCLEVGADFDFDALVTECAPLDSLRQRFGRLNRLGRVDDTRAAIVVRKDQEGSSDDDPVYGASLAATWKWLNQLARDGIVDMGIDALEAALPSDERKRATLLTDLSAPTENAPVMLPAHVDRWVQTDPIPAPDPDPAIFLHGPDRTASEVSVVWRADLEPDVPEDEREESWVATIGLCPPTGIESLQVPLWTLRRWMRTREPDPDEGLSDLEGQSHEERMPGTRGQVWVLLWRGRDESKVTKDPAAVRPNDIVVIPASAGGHGHFGHLPSRPEGSPRIDVAEEAHLRARDRAILRMTPSVMDAWPEADSLRGLRNWANETAELRTDPLQSDEELYTDELDALLGQVAGDAAAPEWLRLTTGALRGRRDTLEHPSRRGWVLQGRHPIETHEVTEAHPFADTDDAYSASTRAVTLEEHLAGSADRAVEFAELCGIGGTLLDDLRLAARLHDIGKADERFQRLLHAGSEIDHARARFLLAKSNTRPESYAAYRRVQSQVGLPRGHRHELASVSLVQSCPDVLADTRDPDLVLHLIATHHGRCRPFAPVFDDAGAGETTFRYEGHTMKTAGCGDLARLDSGVADRFWRLVRRYGWWGLAYLEAILRLADHRQSEAEALESPEAMRAEA